MKILLVSDSHTLKINEEIYQLEKPDFAIHLGDSQLYDVKDLKSYQVKIKGNCDYLEGLSKKEILDINGYRFYLAHGHLENVNYSNEIVNEAKRENCDFVIHGHTHIVRCEKIDDIFIINPGSIAQSRCEIEESYMILHLEDEKHIELKSAKTYKKIDIINI